MGLLDDARAATGTPAPAEAVDAGRIQNDPAFQRLAPASQQRVLGALGIQTQPQTNQLGTLTSEQPPSRPAAPAPRDMPIESAVPGELKKALIDPTYRLLTGRSQGVLGTGMDVLSTAQLAGAGAAFIASGPLGAGSVLLAPTVGATVRGILTDFNASQGWSSFLGGLAEVGTGGVQALGGWRGAMRTARGLVGEAGAAGAVGEGAAAVTKQQEIGGAIIRRANAAFEVRAAPISRAIDGLEKTAATLTVGPDSPAFADVAYLVDKAREYRISTPEIVTLERQLKTGQVKMNDVVTLRKELEGSLSYAKSVNDPNIPASTKLAKEIRAYATDSITSALGPEAGARYGESLLAWRSQVKDPQRIIKTVTSKNLEPSTAFEMVYGKIGPNSTGPKPEVIQTLATLRDVDPTFRTVLRLGAMQHFLAAAGGDLRQTVAGSKALKTIGPMLGTTGLFTPEELQALHVFMRPGMIDQALAGLGHAVSGQTSRVLHLGLAVTGYGGSGSAIYHLMAQHPQLGLMAIAASGGLPLLRRVMLAPPGSAVGRAAAAGIVRGLGDMGAALTNRPSVQLDD